MNQEIFSVFVEAELAVDTEEDFILLFHVFVNQEMYSVCFFIC